MVKQSVRYPSGRRLLVHAHGVLRLVGHRLLHAQSTSAIRNPARPGRTLTELLFELPLMASPAFWLVDFSLCAGVIVQYSPLRLPRGDRATTHLGLHGRPGGIERALDLVAELLSRGLLRVGLVAVVSEGWVDETRRLADVPSSRTGPCR